MVGANRSTTYPSVDLDSGQYSRDSI